jgi:hypothetical protein
MRKSSGNQTDRCREGAEKVFGVLNAKAAWVVKGSLSVAWRSQLTTDN